MGPVEASDLKEHVWPVIGDCKRYEDVTEEKDEDNFTQPGIFWNKVLDQAARMRLVKNIVVSLKDCKGFIQDRAIENFTKVDPEFGRMVRAGVDAEYNVIKDVAPELSQKLKI
uniref:Catalase immune-responsive domain-containing protein n=1 Tax=Acrobeloides nanus TaxID=290746 RepID=A0A914CLR4_9BILA